MKKQITMAFVIMLLSIPAFCQKTTITGSFADAFTEVPLPLVKVSIAGSLSETFTEESGKFRLLIDEILPEDVIIVIEKNGYRSKRLQLNLTNRNIIDLELIFLEPDLSTEQANQNTISLGEAELLSEEGEFDNISGILQSSRDIFQNAAAFDFSQTFFRPKGLGSEYGKVLINGLEMNDHYDGRPVWSMWGGLNDVQRNQIFTSSTAANEFQFGGIGGTTNIVMRASKYQKGSKLALSAANRGYKGRLLATYASGETKNGWYYVMSLGKRYADEALIQGTVYDANSIFLAVEKELSEGNSLNLSALYTPNLRGKSSALTQEVVDLKGRNYNPYWGLQNDRIRNSRIRKTEFPILMLNHYLRASDDLQINTNILFRSGEVANSRIDYGGATYEDFTNEVWYKGGGVSPDPTYFQKLPSYFLRFGGGEDYQAAYLAGQEFKKNGQLDWSGLYRANITAAEQGLNSIYVLADDVNNENQLSVNTILNYSIHPELKMSATLKYSSLLSNYFARINDMLGGKNFLDIDLFAWGLGESTSNAVQSDLKNINRIVREGENYKYDYDISAREAEVFGQLEWTKNNWEIFVGGNLENITYQREGNYKNGLYPDNSLGKSKKTEFLNLGFKTGGIYKFSGKQNVELNIAYLQKAPGIRNSFTNPRQNNDLVPDINSEKISSADFSYRFRSSFFNLRLTGYMINIDDVTEVSYYYSNSLSGISRSNTSAFVQETLYEVQKKYYGFELGSFAQLTSTIRIKTALAIGEYIYGADANLLLSSTAFDGIVEYGTAALKNYHLPGGPQTAAQLGFEYRDPDFWWFSANINYFDRAFSDINSLSRTRNFIMDTDGLPVIGYDPSIAKSLLQQERFDDYYLMNLAAGKSWRLKGKYLGAFISINNLFNTHYKSGGYEQARNANYRSLKTDFNRTLPLFGSKYWFGAGTTFFANVSLRF